jgi:gas vesicle protein
MSPIVVDMNTPFSTSCAPPQEHRSHPFAFGLLIGSAVGAALAIWLTPRVTAVAGTLARKGGRIRDDVAEAVANGAYRVERTANEVARGAREVERYATSAIGS